MIEDGEEIRVGTFTLDEVLTATKIDYRCDPEPPLALWFYSNSKLVKISFSLFPRSFCLLYYVLIEVSK
jgi:hypothetical protein